MLLLLSPAKSLNMEGERIVEKATIPQYADETQQLVALMRHKTSQDLQKMMKVSEKIAQLNVARYARFSTDFTEENSRQALLAFSGDVYRGLDVDSMSDEEVLYAQNHVRILSGLYGILRPLDRMQPYRLEMGTSLPNGAGKDLYEFWRDKITVNLQDTGEYVVNLASQEYSKVVKFDRLEARYVHIHFKERKNDNYRVIGTLAKKARGVFARYMITHKISDEAGLKAFAEEGYCFNEGMSDEVNYVFTRG